jgi:hypothetical protein
MTSAEAFAIMQRRMEPWSRVDPDRVAFVPDEALQYRPNQPVLARRNDAFRLKDENRWNRYLVGNHSWLHANLLFTQNRDPVISLRRGPDVNKVGTWPDGLPFSINVSLEPLLLEWIS